MNVLLERPLEMEMEMLLNERLHTVSIHRNPFAGVNDKRLLIVVCETADAGLRFCDRNNAREAFTVEVYWHDSVHVATVQIHEDPRGVVEPAEGGFEKTLGGLMKHSFGFRLRAAREGRSFTNLVNSSI